MPRAKLAAIAIPQPKRHITRSGVCPVAGLPAAPPVSAGDFPARRRIVHRHRGNAGLNQNEVRRKSSCFRRHSSHCARCSMTDAASPLVSSASIAFTSSALVKWSCFVIVAPSGVRDPAAHSRPRWIPKDLKPPRFRGISEPCARRTKHSLCAGLNSCIACRNLSIRSRASRSSSTDAPAATKSPAGVESASRSVFFE